MRITGGPYSLFRRIRQNCPETYPRSPPWERTLVVEILVSVEFTRQVNLPIRSVQILRIYDAPSLPRKDNRFDQELPSIRGSKVWRKGSRPVAWLDGMVEILVPDNREG